MGHKTCSRCGDELAFDQFDRDKNRPDGRRSACKACRKGKSKTAPVLDVEALAAARREAAALMAREAIATDPERFAMLVENRYRLATGQRPPAHWRTVAA